MATTLASPPTDSQQYTFPSGPQPRPVVGSALDFNHNPLGFVTNLQRTYGKAATVEFLKGNRLVLFFTPAAVRYILTENPKNFLSGVFNSSLKQLLGDGLLTTDGDFHRQQRRLVQPAFHRKRIEQYANTMTQHTEDLVASWESGQIRDISVEMQKLTLRIVAKTLFDVDLKEDSTDLNKAFNDVILFPGERRLAWENILRFDLPWLPYGKFLRGREKLDATVFSIIEQRRMSRHDTGDVISMLLEAQDDDGTVMTDQQVRDQIMTFFAAGHETTANTLSWTFYLLSQNPTVWQKLVDELAHVLGGRTPTMDDLANLPYTDMVLKESMRLYPPAWAMGRTAVEDFDLEGFHLPAGQIVMFPQWVIQRLPSIWGDNADQFVPERFDASHPQEIPQFAYYPFGGGPRMCIGMPFAQMESKLLLATIAQRYTLALVPGHLVVPQPMVTLRPKYGIRMQLEAR